MGGHQIRILRSYSAQCQYRYQQRPGSGKAAGNAQTRVRRSLDASKPARNAMDSQQCLGEEKEERFGDAYREEDTVIELRSVCRMVKDEHQSRGSLAGDGVGSQEEKQTGEQRATEYGATSRRIAGVVVAAAAVVAAVAMSAVSEGVAAAAAVAVAAAAGGAVAGAGVAAAGCDAAVAGGGVDAGCPQEEEVVVGLTKVVAAGGDFGGEGDLDGSRAQQPAPPYTAALPQVDATCVGRGVQVVGMSKYGKRGLEVGVRSPPLILMALFFAGLGRCHLRLGCGGLGGYVCVCGNVGCGGVVGK